jgi:histidine triad (HIT) family protein
VNLDLSDGAEAEQDIPHVHMHVVPRHSDDAVAIELPGTRTARHELDRVAAKLAQD